MPNRWPINSGSWSDSAIWSGSLIPTASDDVFLNNQVVTLDQNIIVASINNTATAGVIAGGRLNIFSDYNITATPNGINSSGANVSNGFIQYYNSGSIIITSTLLASRYTLGNINNGTITINGDVRHPINNSTNLITVTNVSSGTINIVGNIVATVLSNLANYAVYNATNGTINVIGNVSAGTSQGSCHGIVNNSNGIINVTGNVIGGIPNANGGFGIQNTSIGTVNITGNVNGGSSTICHGVNNASIGTINITGNVTAGTSTAVGINSTTAGIINIIGQLQATTLNNAVSSTSTTATNIFSGPFINSGSRNAIYCYNVRLYDDNTTRYTIGVSGSTDTISLLSPDQVTGVPSGSDVRFGTTYGPGAELTGSMQVPNPQSVSVGVAVDGTVGTAIVKPEDLWNYAVTSLTASNSIGQRLASTSTSASNAAIINAFG
jgi:hypothetical protein